MSVNARRELDEEKAVDAFGTCLRRIRAKE
jgi:hypothetical protein